MSKLIDAALGLHPQALSIASKRLELIANNVANADTPGFKARDIDFRSVLAEATQSAGTLARTNSGHLGTHGPVGTPEALYRTPIHPSLDGNTVDSQLEQAAFAEASVRYQATLDLLDGRIGTLRKALRGE